MHPDQPSAMEADKTGEPGKSGKTEQPVADAAQRAEALDNTRSFIVQAPAGSGKTELLIQRHLKLLGLVEAPEEVVAITFTRKAAGEMRLRVLEALEQGRLAEPPPQAHQLATWELARKVVQRDLALGWGISESPARLRIQTIDSLSASITRQMPWLSRFGGQPASVENAAHLYQQAARGVLAHLHGASGKGDGPAGETVEAVSRLLSHLDNDLARAAELLQTMLARRDQWLRHVRHDDPATLRASLENVLAGLCIAATSRAGGLMPAAARAELPELAAYAAQNLAEEGKAGAILACENLAGFPEANVEQLPHWKGLAALLLTDKGTWRKSITKAMGFPASSSGDSAGQKERFAHMKARMERVIDLIASTDKLAGAMRAVQALPPPVFPDGQWEVLEALLTLLPVAVAELRKVFAQAGEVDFSDVSLGAVEALEYAPDAKAPLLDYRIRHLLVDEFQDTSFNQVLLLERLTADWEEGDGRTLFLVGDPMQSIYRFREADVSLYLRARRGGISRVRLHPLTLSVNFRSQQNIVHWLNEAFPRVFPHVEDELSGAVAYSPCTAFHPAGAAPAVQMHPWLERDDQQEALRVVELVRQATARHPDGKVAILVRARTHLARIIPTMQGAGLAFQAIDIDPLGTRPTVQDLLALTRALHHPADRVAWLALLRAPWCGLQLADLLALAGEWRGAIWDALNAPQAAEPEPDQLSKDGAQRLTRVKEALATVLRAHPGRALRPRVEGCWLALGGAAGLDEAELAEARAFLALLDEMDGEGGAFDLAELQTRVDRMFAPPDPAAAGDIQIMSIHKAKGLQFDTVIVPGMGRRSGRNDPSLLLWTELSSEDGERELLLAPISEAGETADEIYNYVAQLHKERERLEIGRLLYVAVTRAKQQVHLLGHVKVNDKGLTEPPQGTLLNQLWPVVEEEFSKALEARESQPVADAPEPSPGPSQAAASQHKADGGLRRLAAGWVLPPPPERIAGAPDEPHAEEAGDKREYLWAGDSARHIGTVVHHMLQSIALQGVAGWDAGRIAAHGPFFRAELARLGVPQAELDQGIARVGQALEQTLAHETGKWLLGPHEQAEAELALTAVLDGQPVHVVIDRTFVDEQGTRWIVDYKTGSREGGDREGYLDNELAEYRPQLERYARILRKHDPAHPIRLMLYFPLMQASREWEPGQQTETAARPHSPGC